MCCRDDAALPLEAALPSDAALPSEELAWRELATVLTHGVTAAVAALAAFPEPPSAHSRALMDPGIFLGILFRVYKSGGRGKFNRPAYFCHMYSLSAV